MSVLCKVWSPDNQVVSSISSEVTGGDGGAEVFSDVRTGDLAVDGRADEAVGTNVDLTTEVVSFGSANNDGVIAGGDVIPRILEVIVLLPPRPAHLAPRPE